MSLTQKRDPGFFISKKPETVYGVTFYRVGYVTLRWMDTCARSEEEGRRLLEAKAESYMRYPKLLREGYRKGLERYFELTDEQDDETSS